jgi:hypothetical protein
VMTKGVNIFLPPGWRYGRWGEGGGRSIGLSYKDIGRIAQLVRHLGAVAPVFWGIIYVK